jgi:hypothetical protein
MCSSNDEEVVIDLQTIHNQYIVISFNKWVSFDVLQKGLVILRTFRFGVLFVIGFNPTKVQIGDIAIKITHNGFTSRV